MSDELHCHPICPTVCPGDAALMCGICGTFAYGATTGIDAELVQSMLHAIAHRGPDGEGLYSDGSVCLGHRRLSIIDVVPKSSSTCMRIWVRQPSNV